ncbi:MAG: hypothetical protein LBL91_01700 [Lachnospiraceae bacterium]|jgi:hypothetical protein|nr:hypothetical protein [Lachnospiraceae bacterium]
MKKKYFDYIIVTIGIILFFVGIYFVRTIQSSEGVWKALPYLLIGMGSGLFGTGMVIGRKNIEKNPEIRKNYRNYAK